MQNLYFLPVINRNMNRMTLFLHTHGNSFYMLVHITNIHSVPRIHKTLNIEIGQGRLLSVIVVVLEIGL